MAALLAQAGDELVESRPLGELHRDVIVAPLVDRRLEQLCGGPVGAMDWRLRLGEARRALQRLELGPALAGFAVLEAELPCLTERLAPEEQLRYRVGAIELHLVASRLHPPDARAFHLAQARRAAAQAAALGSGLEPPGDTLDEALVALQEARREASGEAPARAVVVGPAERVWWGGRPAGGAVLDLPAGEHLLQLTDEGDRVIAVQLVELAPGGALVIWARPESSPLSGEEVRDGVRALQDGGSASLGLAPALRALSARQEAMIAVRTAGRLRVWSEQDGKLRLRIAEPEPERPGRGGGRPRR